jgi:hypothetical protein
MDGSIADYAMAQEERAITVTFNIAEGPWETGGNEIAVYLIWKFPKSDTMLNVDPKNFQAEGVYWIRKEEIPLPSASNNYAPL